MGKIIPYTTEQVANAQRDAWYSELRRRAFARTPNYLYSVGVLICVVIWIALCTGTLALLQTYGMLPMQGNAPLFMMLTWTAVVGILAFFLFRFLNKFMEGRYEKELRKVFTQFNEPYPYEGQKLL